MSTSTPTAQQTAGPGAGGPPVPPVKPVLSSPGAYMANFQGSGGGGGMPVAAPPITAGIHGTNKTHEKPTIAARPIPPPKLPNYSSSFNKIDRDRNEFTKIDKAEREKVSLVRNRDNLRSGGGEGGGMDERIIIVRSLRLPEDDPSLPDCVFVLPFPKREWKTVKFY